MWELWYVGRFGNAEFMVCWSIWKSKNDLVWSQKFLEVGEVVKSARVVLSQ